LAVISAETRRATSLPAQTGHAPSLQFIHVNSFNPSNNKRYESHYQN
jgi:hypothetical protein